MDSVESDAGQQMLYQIGGFKTIILFRMILKPAECCKTHKNNPVPISRPQLSPNSFYHICSSVCLLIWGSFRVRPKYYQERA
jgi:hypothetical protein